MATNVRRVRPLSREGGFAKALKTALDLLHHPRVGIVASTQVRADFIREVCSRFVQDPEDNVRTYLDPAAADAFQGADHHLVVLDASVAQDTRAVLKILAKERVPACKVIEIKKWSVEPPL